MEEIKIWESIDQWLSSEIVKMYKNEVAVKQSLTEWVRKSSHPKLKTLLQHYFDIIKHHVNSLEAQIDKEQELKAVKKSNGVMEAIIKECNKNIEACTDYSLADVCLISGIQTINHYKISMYGTLATIAEMLGKNKMAFLIRDLEGNEKKTDLQLTEMATHGINQAAIIGIGR